MAPAADDGDRSSGKPGRSVHDEDWGAVVCELARFYPGADPWRWLSEIPLGVVKEARRLVPRLVAAEGLRMAMAISVAFGSAPQTRDEWIALVKDEGETAPVDRAARVAQVEAAGIKVFGPKQRT